MMKMASGDDFPSDGVPDQGPDWFFVAIEAYGGGTYHLRFFSGGFGIYRNFWRQPHVKGTLDPPPGLAPMLWGSLLVHKNSS